MVLASTVWPLGQYTIEYCVQDGIQGSAGSCAANTTPDMGLPHPPTSDHAAINRCSPSLRMAFCLPIHMSLRCCRACCCAGLRMQALRVSVGQLGVIVRLKMKIVKEAPVHRYALAG